MKILMVVNIPPESSMGGAEVVTSLHIQALREAGHSVHVVSTDMRASLLPWKRSVRVSEDRTTFTSFNVYHFVQRPKSKLWRIPWLALDVFNPVHNRLLRKVAREFRPDIVVLGNLWNLSTGVWRELKRGSAPVVHVLHDGAVACVSGFFWHGGRDCDGTRLPCRMLAGFRRWQSRDVDAIVTPSRFLANAVASRGLFARASVSVVPNPSPPPMKSRRVHHDENRLVVGFLGAMSAFKGFDILVQACLDHDGVRCLTVAGMGTAEQAARAQTLLGDRLHLLGRIPRQEVPAVLATLDVLVVPSLCQENSPTVIAEGQAAGVCVVASDSGGARELITDGVDGFILPRGDVRELRQRLAILAERPTLRSFISDNAIAAASRRSQSDGGFVQAIEAVPLSPKA